MVSRALTTAGTNDPSRQGEGSRRTTRPSSRRSGCPGSLPAPRRSGSLSRSGIPGDRCHAANPEPRRPKEPAAGVPVGRSMVGLHQRHRRWRCDRTRGPTVHERQCSSCCDNRRARDAGDGESSLQGSPGETFSEPARWSPPGRAPGSSACAEDSRTEQVAIPSATRRVAQRNIVRNMRSTAARRSGGDYFVADSIVQLPSPHEVTTDDAEPLEG